MLVLEEAGRPLTAAEICHQVRVKNLYRMKDDRPVTVNQVTARIRNYLHLFTVDETRRPKRYGLAVEGKDSLHAQVTTPTGSVDRAGSHGTAVAVLGELLGEILTRPVLEVAMVQRAKFEGWLKLELAYALRQHNVECALEVPVDGTSYRADIGAKFPDGERVLVMLKTVNTNFGFSGIESRTRPITRNIDGVIDDLNKLSGAQGRTARLVAFTVAPVHADEGRRDRQLHGYLQRIEERGRGHVERSGFVRPRYAKGEWGIGWFLVTTT